MDNSNIEFYILILITKSETFLLKIGEYLYTEDVKELTKRSYFDNRHAQTFFNLCYYIYSKTNRLASLKDMEFLVSNIFKNADQRQEILDIVHDVFQCDDEINWQLIEDEALKFVKDKKFIEALSSAQKDLENKDYDAVIEKLQKSTQVSFEADYGVSIKDWDKVKEVLKETADVSEAIPTGYDMLDSDRVLNGGFRRKTLNLVGANSGIGKTMMLCNFALNACLAGKNVLYISLETSASRLVSRILANLLDTTTTRISYELSDNGESEAAQGETSEGNLEQDYLKAISSVPGNLRVKEFQTGSMNCNKVETFILDLKKNLNETYDMVILDYLSILTPNDKKISKENSYTYDGAIAVDMRALSYSQNCVVLSGIQMNRESIKGEKGDTKTIIATDGIANSLTIEMTADFIITLSRDETHRKKGRLLCYVAKNRNNEKGQQMDLQVLENCRFEEVKEKNGQK